MKKSLIFRSLILSLILIFTFASSTFANTSPTIKRLAGFDRYETASQIALSGWSQSDYAILAYGENFPDALAAAPLAKKYNAPILLTTSNNLPLTTKQTLISLQVKNVLIIGGTGVISSLIDTELQSLGISSTRIFGNDKYETAIKIAQQVTPTPSELFVVTGEDYPDALSVASIASIKQIPIILVPYHSIPDPVKDYIATNKISKTYVIGNSDMISDKVFNTFPNAERIWGTDKYLRNIAVNKIFSSDFKLDNICIATGEGFADALTGTAYSAKISEPIILINNDSPITTKDYYQHIFKNANNVYVFGGPGIISDSVIQGLNSTVAVPLPVDQEITEFIELIKANQTVDGAAIIGVSYVPFEITFTDFEESTGNFTGELTWLDYGTIALVEGNISGQSLSFKETKLLKHVDGIGLATTSYYLNFSEPGELSGYWKDSIIPPYKGDVWINLK
jgi:putative cell wall-binding protein